MAHPTAVILVVGLNRSLISDATPHLQRFSRGGCVRRLRPVLPAVTCSVQSSMLTGLPPAGHGVVGNGWYDRVLAEVQFWKQSNHLVGGEKVWDAARRRDPTVRCAQLFWWYNMYAAVDYAVTPRPCYKADGRKIPDCHTQPADLRDRLTQRLGPFPLFQFWGPGATIQSSRWIADAARLVYDWHRPTLNLVYLPHLDYSLQKHGPDHPQVTRAAAEVDAVAGELINSFQADGVRVMVLSEYGIEAVDSAVAVNRVLREHGLLQVREEQGRELLDAGGSAAFAVADHQVAHVYVRSADSIPAVAEWCRGIPGVEQVLAGPDRAAAGLDHPRCGELVLVAERRRWFSYDYWQDDRRAPDFARTVDIHRKPGYDPLELFIDPALRWPAWSIGWRLLRRRLGMRTLLDVIPLNTTLVRGSHGRVDLPVDLQPLLITTHDRGTAGDPLPCQAVKQIILDHLFQD